MEEERIVLKKKILIHLQDQKVEEKETEQVEQK